MDDTSVFCKNLYSHRNPDRLLETHLLDTKVEIKKYVKDLSFDVKLPKSILLEIAEIIAISHDIGKATTFFQEYLKVSAGKDRKAAYRLTKNKLHTHGLISAIYTFFMLTKYISKKEITEKLINEKVEELGRFIPYIGFLCVKRHHGDLEDVYDEFWLKKRQIELVNKLNQNFHPEFFNLLKFISREVSYEITKDEFDIFLDQMIEDISNFEEYFLDVQTYNIALEIYYLTIFLFSILTDSDKTCAMGLKKPKIEQIEGNVIDEYKKKRFPTKQKNHDKISIIRNSIYKEVTEKINDIGTSSHIFTITAPTGTGKTLAALSAAIRLSNQILKEKGVQPKIIYCLPFLSIIDQNATVIERILKYEDMKKLDNKIKVEGETLDKKIDDKLKKDKISSSKFLVNHHLTDIFYKTNEEDYDKDKSQFLTEDWHSRIIITTFYQLFHCLFTNKNRAIRRVHNIYNSIIILDEIQSIPHKYWLLIRKTLIDITKRFNVFIFLTTATQPWLFDKKDEVKELVEEKDKYFEQLNRTRIKLKLDKILLSEFHKATIELIRKNPDANILFVMNTIDQAKRVYNHIKNNSNIKELHFLSSKILPRIRRERIKNLEELLKRKKNVVIISTQLIEAGVDFDVDIVVRDFCPMDSINQVAGRCNRHNRKDTGIVYVYNIKDDRKKETNRTFSSYIYDQFLLFKTHQVLEGKTEIEEIDFSRIIDEYFKKIAKDGNRKESEELLNAIQNLYFKGISRFQLIENQAMQVPVFIEVDEISKDIWKQYMALWSLEDWKERNKSFLEIKNHLYQNLINVNKDIASRFPEIRGFYYISFGEAHDYYDEETGFFYTNETVQII